MWSEAPNAVEIVRMRTKQRLLDLVLKVLQTFLRRAKAFQRKEPM